MNIWMIEETREIAQTLQSVVSGWALTSMPAFCFYTRKRRCYSRWNDNTPFWLVDQEQNSIWFVWVSPAPCISLLRELSLTSDRSAVFFSFSVCDIAPPLESVRAPHFENHCSRMFSQSERNHLRMAPKPIRKLYLCHNSSIAFQLLK